MIGIEGSSDNHGGVVVVVMMVEFEDWRLYSDFVVVNVMVWTQTFHWVCSKNWWKVNGLITTYKFRMGMEGQIDNHGEMLLW